MQHPLHCVCSGLPRLLLLAQHLAIRAFPAGTAGSGAGSKAERVGRSQRGSCTDPGVLCCHAPGAHCLLRAVVPPPPLPAAGPPPRARTQLPASSGLSGPGEPYTWAPSCHRKEGAASPTQSSVASTSQWDLEPNSASSFDFFFFFFFFLRNGAGARLPGTVRGQGFLGHFSVMDSLVVAACDFLPV